MALDDAQVVTLAELIGETPDAAQSALDAAARVYDSDRMAAIESSLVALLAEYAPVRHKGGFRLKGGRDGLDLDKTRTVAELRNDARKMLGLPTYVDASDPNAVRAVTMAGPRWL